MPQIGEIRNARELIKSRRYDKYIWSACLDCGKTRWVVLVKGKPESNYCSSCARKHWARGWYKDKKGYIYIKLETNDFFYPMAKGDGYIPEHRLVMARYLKRHLLRWEVIHHKNGIKDDNRLENLQLLSCNGKHNKEINKRIKELERIVEKQTTQIKLLEFHIQELNKRLKVEDSA